LLGFGSIRVLPSVRVEFDSSYLQAHKIWVRFGFGFIFFEFGSLRFYPGSEFDGFNFSSVPAETFNTTVTWYVNKNPKMSV